MAWDSKAARARQNSNAGMRHATSENIHPSKELIPIVPKSSHNADPVLQPFLAPSFDPAEYLNDTLPPLKSTSSSHYDTSQSVSLAELSTQTQTLLSQLSAHTTRLTNTLTQLTDEILRSGSRLTYEVEVLRGETIGLSEALTDGLQEDISKFVPRGLGNNLERRGSRHFESNPANRRASGSMPKIPVSETSTPGVADPEYIAQLRTLTSVRERLDTVIKTFGDAMAWTFPPSELSVSSAFLSVSAPEPGSEAHSTEEKGQEVSKKLRDEITDLLAGGDDPVACVEAAAKRVQELKELSKVWDGTAEEKARGRFVDSLVKLVEEKHRELLRELEHNGLVGQTTEAAGNKHEAPSTGSAPGKVQGGYGFISQLQKMRSGL